MTKSVVFGLGYLMAIGIMVTLPISAQGTIQPDAKDLSRAEFALEANGSATSENPTTKDSAILALTMVDPIQTPGPIGK